MACRAYLIAGLASLGVLLFLAGCRGDQDPPSSPTPSVVDSTSAPQARDSLAAANTPVLAADPVAPIVENPDTEATGNESIGHCDVRASDNLCIDFTGSAWSQLTAQAECENAPRSSFRTETCPSGNRIGTCVIHPNGDAALELVHSFYEPMDAILAEAICPGRFEAE